MDERDPAFLGRGWAFPPRFDPGSGAAVMAWGEEDIRESLRILFLTTPGERIMQPAYGCALRRLVFEPMDAATVGAIAAAIKRAILFFEPRIEPLTIEVWPVDWPGGQLGIYLGYRVLATNTRHNIVFPFYLDEGTLVAGAPEPVG